MTWLGLLLLTLCCMGCDLGKDRDNPNGFGFIEVKSAFELKPGDAFMYGGILLTSGSDRKINSVYKVPVGSGFITLERTLQQYRICPLQVRQNRVVSISLTSGRNGIACDIKH